VIVVDASVIAPALADDGEDGVRARSRLRGERIAAPELLDLEVISTIRKAHRAGHLDDRRADMAIADLNDFDLERVSHRPLLLRIWELRANVTAYEAAYVALAEALGTPLLTSDIRLSRSPGFRCDIEILR
jgi:predicted nucleic acid-binding protein